MSRKGNSMATKKQTAANRRNARKSTGPTSPQGKATASMNGLRHGLRARTVILPGEKQEDFDEIFAGLQDEYQPQCQSEQYLVNQAAIAQWKLVRAEAYEARSCEKDPSIEACNDMFRKMTLVTGRLERAYFKAYKELERIKAARRKQPQPPDQPHKSQESDESANPAINLYWTNPETGERTLAAQTPAARDIHDLSQEQLRPQPQPLVPSP
jgi:hypothetical protein